MTNFPAGLEYHCATDSLFAATLLVNDDFKGGYAFWQINLDTLQVLLQFATRSRGAIVESRQSASQARLVGRSPVLHTLELCATSECASGWCLGTVLCWVFPLNFVRWWPHAQ